MIVALLLGLGLMLGAAASRAAPPPPNFVVLLCDDLGYGDLGCFGNRVIRTPNLDRLATQGLKLTSCYAGAPVCSPSRSALQTGRAPQRERIFDWIPLHSPMHLAQGAPTLASALKGVGYQTCAVGKWHLTGVLDGRQPMPNEHGYDHYFVTQNNALPSHHDPVNFVRDGRPVGPLRGNSATLTVNEALGWLKQRDRRRPFLLYVAFHAPHEPIATDERFVKMYPEAMPRNRAIYYGNVSQMDDEAGRLLRYLDEAGLRRNTAVVFTSDNGPETLNRYRGAARSYGSPGELRGMKLWLYEGGIRIPGIVRWPGVTRPGSVSDEPISGVDWLPTLAHAAGARLPASRRLDGSDARPILRGGRRIQRRRPLFWIYQRALGNPKAALRDGDWKLLADADFQQLELYNLADDRREIQDLAAAYPRRVRRMARRLRGLLSELPKPPAGR